MANEMVPELQAAADRLMHTGGYLRHLAAEMRPNELERHCKATGLTVRQTIGHIVLWLEFEVGRNRRFLDGEDVIEESLDVDDVNRGFADAARETSVAELLGRYMHAYHEQVQIYGHVTSELAAQPVRGTTVAGLLLELTAHFQHHAVDFAEALPRLRFDPLLLDWALHPRSPDPSEGTRQEKLAEAARAYLKSREDTDDA